MKKLHIYTVFATAALLLAGCGQQGGEGDKQADDAVSQDTIMVAEMTSMELNVLPLPCSKEKISEAWKNIGEDDKSVAKEMDYRHSNPTFFISADLDGDELPEVILHGDAAHAAVLSYANDTLTTIAYVAHPQLGIALAEGGFVVRSGNIAPDVLLTEFVRLEKSQIVDAGMSAEKFNVKNKKFVSAGMRYQLKQGEEMVEVKKDEFLQRAPGNLTYLDALEGWEDFRKP